MNRLKLSRCYLIGPMDHNRDGGREWRVQMTEFLKKELKCIPFDPYNKPLQKEMDFALEDDESFNNRKKAIEDGDFALARELIKPIVHADLRMVDHADFLICYLDVDTYACGTYDEMFMAALENKPVVVMCPQGLNRIPPWLFGRLPYQMFFDTWNAVKMYLKHIDRDDRIDTHGRWKFFDLEAVTREILEM